jgi:DNA-binding MarR family transcriptional regulator
MSDRAKNQLSLQVLKKFRVIFGSVRQQFHEIEQACGVSGSQLWILQEVANMPGIGITELSKRLSIHSSTGSQLVEKLVARGAIIKERGNEDQRRVGLWLTGDAAALLEKAPGAAEGILPEALRALSEPALQALDGSLDEVIGQFAAVTKNLPTSPCRSCNGLTMQYYG